MRGKLFAIMLFFCFVAPIATTFIILEYQKKQVKREIKRKIIAGLDREELVLLKFTEKEKNTQLKWKHAKEFEYQGEMYDIVETMVVGDTTYYWLWWDHEETKLNKQLKELVSLAMRSNPKNHNNQKQLIYFFKSLYFSEPNKSEPFDFIDMNEEYPTDNKLFSSIYLYPQAPPPKRF